MVASCRLGILDGGSNATTGDSATTSAAVLPEDCAARYAPAESCLECSMGEGCRGGSLCRKGYEGTACSDCSPNFYLLNNKCHACGNNAWATLVGGAAVFLVAAAVVYHFGAASDGFVSLSVTITHVQLLSSYAGFSVAWPPVFVRWMRWITAFVMMKLEFARRISVYFTAMAGNLTAAAECVAIFFDRWPTPSARSRCRTSSGGRC